MYLELGHKLETIYSRYRTVGLLYHILTSNLWKPSHTKVLFSDLKNPYRTPQDSIVHCKAALRWLFKAQDASEVGGVAAEYNFSWGWCLPYPEVSGYIIPTLLDLTQQFSTELDTVEIEARASRIADWLVSIQNQNGSYNAGLYYNARVHNHAPLAQRIAAERKPRVFETGQILWGLGAIYERTGDKRYLEAGIKSADWLVQQQSTDGSWPCEEQEAPVSFSALTARNLALFSKITEEESYKKAAARNCDWCLRQQNNVGWFDLCTHTEGLPPWTHGIGYAAQGLLEAGIYLNNSEYLEGATKTADALLRVYSLKGFKSVYQQEQGFMPARFDNRWKSKDRFSCLVGNAQISLVWSILYQVTNDIRYLNGALKINEHLKSLQRLQSSNPGIMGGIKGSQPIWGLYRSFGYPAEAAKFFIDALIAEEKALNKLREEVLKE